MRNALALAAHMNVSTLSTVAMIELLSTPRLPELLRLNSTRLTEVYTMITNFLSKHGIPYFPCNAAPFILAKIAPHAINWDDELDVVQKLQENGVLVGGGRRYHVLEFGWARISFAMSKPVLQEAIKRMEKVFCKI
jgi:aspartate/methionine/tyrosine aminotransferase